MFIVKFLIVLYDYKFLLLKKKKGKLIKLIKNLSLNDKSISIFYNNNNFYEKSVGNIVILLKM